MLCVLLDRQVTIQEYLTLVPALMESEQATPPRGFNKGRSSKFHVGSWVQQTPEEGWRTYRLKRCENDNKNEDNSPKSLNDKNHQALSQKLRTYVLQVLTKPSCCRSNHKSFLWKKWRCSWSQYSNQIVQEILFRLHEPWWSGKIR